MLSNILDVIRNKFYFGKVQASAVGKVYISAPRTEGICYQWSVPGKPVMVVEEMSFQILH